MGRIELASFVMHTDYQSRPAGSRAPRDLREKKRNDRQGLPRLLSTGIRIAEARHWFVPEVRPAVPPACFCDPKTFRPGGSLLTSRKGRGRNWHKRFLK